MSQYRSGNNIIKFVPKPNGFEVPSVKEMATMSAQLSFLAASASNFGMKMVEVACESANEELGKWWEENGKDLEQGRAEPETFNEFKVSAIEGVCQETVAEQLQPYCAMFLHFGWYVPYVFLMSAKEELLESSAQGRRPQTEDAVPVD